MIKIISFDIGGTLLEAENKSQENYSLKELTKLTNLPYEKVRVAYKEVFQKSKGTFGELISNFCLRLGIKENEKIINFFSNKFSSKENKSKISKDKIILIKKLKASGYKVILFSNSCYLINNNSIDKVINLVDEIFYSYDIGYTKDEAESYDYIENKMQVKSNEILHIGDTLKSDYIIPIKNGWNALLYGKSDDKNIKTISSLIELYDILKDNGIIPD